MQRRIKKVLSCFLNSPVSPVDLMSTGSLFHAFGAATSKAFSEEASLVLKPCSKLVIDQYIVGLHKINIRIKLIYNIIFISGEILLRRHWDGIIGLLLSASVHLTLCSKFPYFMLVLKMCTH